MAPIKINPNEEIETDYSQINGTKKILYWDGEKWMKPQKDNQKGFKGGWLANLESQPTNVKTITPVKETEFSGMYN